MQGYEILRVLSSGQFYSGQHLAQKLAISRTAVWNKIQQLRELGVEVFAVQGKGYRLADPLELLDVAAIVDALKRIRSDQLTIDVFAEIDSTNRYLLQRMFDEHAGKPRVVIAESQKAGRGRRGREWVSPFGSNIYLSLLWRFEKGIEAIEGLSLVVGMAMIDALSAIGFQNVGLKWPNDLYYDNRKLGGILLEMAGEASGPCHVVIGVGLNVNMSRHAASRIDQPWIDLREMKGDTVSRNEVTAAILDELVTILRRFEQTGFGPFKAHWPDYDLLYGQEVDVHEAHGMRHGIAKGIDDSGALLIENTVGIQRVLSGDVSVRINRELG